MEEVIKLKLICTTYIISWQFRSTIPRNTHVKNYVDLSLQDVRKGADKSLAFPIFLFAAQSKEFFLDRLKKLEQRNHKSVELRGEYVE
jgi:hypothetical protein